MADIGFRIDQSDLVKKVDKLVGLTSKEMISVFNRSLAKSASQTVVKEARRDLKKWLSFSEDSTGETARSLGVKSARKKPLVLVGGRKGKYNSQLIHILDQGTEIRTTKDGKNTGRVLGLNFYLNAYKAKVNSLESEMIKNMNDNYLKKVVKKLE
ncbi:hypothetical protein [Carboxylicivirga sp. RSCT41]|uniref:hypothetical protein n=1 Tax=Carboxylicivirga agarovorans TaxID=3417570 RepID=UPI003D34FCA3